MAHPYLELATQEDEARAQDLAAVLKDAVRKAWSVPGNHWAPSWHLVVARFILTYSDEFSINNMLTQQPKS